MSYFLKKRHDSHSLKMIVYIENSNWSRPLWEEDQKVVKRSDRNDPMWNQHWESLFITIFISN
jgi:hypothetical protein